MAETRRKFDAEFRAGAVPRAWKRLRPRRGRQTGAVVYLEIAPRSNLFGDVDGLVGG
jgi:hypothetical protein